MALPLVKIGNPVLRKPAISVSAEQLEDPRFKKFIEDMIETMHLADGVGLAANQVGRCIRAVVLECKGNPRYPGKSEVPLAVYLNPKIISYSKETETDWEGCLSIPGYRGPVPRSCEVTFEAMTPGGKKVTKTVNGFHARIIQHEVDHINGLFYVDRMPDLKHLSHLDEMENLKTEK